MIFITTSTYDKEERLISCHEQMNTEDTIQMLANTLDTFEDINFHEVYDRIYLVIGHCQNSKIIVIESSNSLEMMPVIGFIYWWASGWGETTRLLARKIANNCELGYNMRFENLQVSARQSLITNPIIVAIIMTYGFWKFEDIEYALSHIKHENIVTTCAIAKEFDMSLKEVDKL